MACSRARARLLLLAAVAGASLASGCGSAAQPAASSPGSSSAGAPSAAASAAGASSAGASAGCPTAAAVSAAMGVTYPAPQVGSGAGGTMCNYSGAGNANGNDVSLIISSGINASELHSLATAQGGVSSVVAVPGLGNGAYMDAGNSGLSSELFVLKGTEGIEVTAFGTPAQLESVARAVLAG